MSTENQPVTVKEEMDKKGSDSLVANSMDYVRARNGPANKYEHTQSKELCSDEEALIEAVFDSVPGLLYLYTKDGRLIRWNKQHENMTGYTSKELMNFRAEDWFDEGDRLVLAREWPKVFSEGYNEVELNLKLKDGSRVPYLLSGVRVELNGEPHLVGIGIDISERKKAEEEGEKALHEIRRLKELLEAENIYLKKERGGPFEFDEIIGQSDALQYVLFRAQQVAQTDSTVLITGETGTGKGRIANLIHQKSERKHKNLVTVGCGALPGNLIESELFGREKGAFTGAESKQLGRFDVADGGTIFLDEIAELPIELQAKLLRVIESGEFERLGSPHTVKVNVRIIASTNRNLDEEISEGRFRQDLFYRLNIFPITMPPLREHKEDIPLLVDYFLKKYGKRFDKQVKEISEETMRALQTHTWPGNVRELMGIIERAVITSGNTTLDPLDVIGPEQTGFITHERQIKKALANVEKDHILRILEETFWKIEGPNGAAQLLAMNPSTLRNKMKKLGIRRPHLSR